MGGRTFLRVFVAAVAASRFASGSGDALAGEPKPSLAELEKQVAAAPNDVALRARALEAYLLERSPEARAARARHALWVIAKAPEAPIAGLPYAQLDRILDRDTYPKGQDLWLSHVAKEPVAADVLWNAAQYFFIHDKERAAELLKRGMQLEPTQPRWKENLAHLLTLSESVAGERAGDALELRESALVDTEEDGRSYALQGLAETALQAGQDAKARAYAEELLALSERPQGEWNRGNAVHEGNRILGHLALRSGDVEGAKEFLLKAGATSGSPVLNSFGPELTLAKDLLAKGERETVIQYLEMCRRFWKKTDDQLGEWIAEIRAGGTPDLNRFRAKRTEPTASR